jgi:hypothetical protein
MRIIAFIEPLEAIEKILTHLPACAAGEGDLAHIRAQLTGIHCGIHCRVIRADRRPGRAEGESDGRPGDVTASAMANKERER